jgi:hypothetical protein
LPARDRATPSILVVALKLHAARQCIIDDNIDT